MVRFRYWTERDDAFGICCRERPADELTRAGTPVGFDGLIHVLEEETCFFVFDALSRREAALVAEQASLGAVRVVEAITSREE